MSDHKQPAPKPDGSADPAPESKPHAVDQAVQEEAGKERSENEGYD